MELLLPDHKVFVGEVKVCIQWTQTDPEYRPYLYGLAAVVDWVQSNLFSRFAITTSITTYIDRMLAYLINMGSNVLRYINQNYLISLKDVVINTSINEISLIMVLGSGPCLIFIVMCLLLFPLTVSILLVSHGIMPIGRWVDGQARDLSNHHIYLLVGR